MIAHYLESNGLSRRGSRTAVNGVAALLLAGIVTLEWLYALDYSLGVLYAVPVAIAATVLTRWQTIAAAVGCALLRGWFTPGLPPIEYSLRFAMALLAYGGIGVLITEVSRHRRALLAALGQQRAEQDLRRRAEDQLETLVESSPAAIMTLDQHATVVAANRAAHDLFGVTTGTLVGLCIARHVPVFAGALRVASTGTPVRVSSSCWVQRTNGSRFPAAVWFSTYERDGERYLAGIVVDTSEDVREREHEMFRQMAESHRLLADAVAHEIRNLCSAIRVVTANLRRDLAVTEHVDVVALGTLIESLMRIAAFELTSRRQPAVARVDLPGLLEQLRVVVETDWADAGGTLVWDTDTPLPPVHADEHALLQVFLNVSQNALRAGQQSGQPTLRVRTRADGSRTLVSFEDDGPGVDDPGRLFQPFREGADGSGLGLYVSRAMMRGFGGDLTHVATASGCRFDVTIPISEDARSQVA